MKLTVNSDQFTELKSLTVEELTSQSVHSNSVLILKVLAPSQLGRDGEGLFNMNSRRYNRWVVGCNNYATPQVLNVQLCTQIFSTDFSDFFPAESASDDLAAPSGRGERH